MPTPTNSPLSDPRNEQRAKHEALANKIREMERRLDQLLCEDGSPPITRWGCFPWSDPDFQMVIAKRLHEGLRAKRDADDLAVIKRVFGCRRT